MSTFLSPSMLVLLLLALNFAIGWWNAKVCGWLWNEQEFMGFFSKLVLYSAAVQSVVAFSSVLTPAFLLVAVLVASPTPEQTAYLIEFGMSFWYVLVIIPAIGTGLVLTLHAWIQFIRSGNWIDGIAAGWNTYASIQNMYNASQSLGPAWDKVREGLSQLATPSSGDGKAVVVRLTLAALLVAMLSSVLLTAWIIRRNMGRLPMPVGVQARLSRERA